MTHDVDEMVKTSQKIVRECSDHLAGHGHMVQGAALADLVAMWLAGVQGDDKLRKDIFDNFLVAVRGLTKINSEILLGREMNKAKGETKQ